MKFIVIEQFGNEEVIYAKAPEKPTNLSEFFNGHHEDITDIQVNNQFLSKDNWKDHILSQNDEIRVYVKTEFQAIYIVLLIISIALSIASALTRPKPKKASNTKSQPALGVAGIQNTIAPGTPKFLTYGIRRVFGHLIASAVGIENSIGRADSGTTMSFSALYYMGTGPICGISDVKINGTHLCDFTGPLPWSGNPDAPQYPPPEAYVRLGTQDQTIIPRHEIVHQVYGAERSMDYRGRPSTSKKQVAGFGNTTTYTTKGAEVNKVSFFFQFPEGLWDYGVHGKKYKATAYLEIKRKRNSDTPGEWTYLGEFPSITTDITDGFFWQVDIENPDADRWDYQMRVRPSGHGSFGTAPSMVLFNVMETQYKTTTYPGNALLEIHGIATEQINGFDNMAASGIVDGRLVEVYQNGIYTRQCSRNRVWIIRDLLLDPDIGLGNRIHASLWDNAAGAVAADYYEENVTGFDGVTEQRDFCDVIINDARPGWDWLKILLFEGRAALIPSGGKLKYLLDVDKPANLLYSSPGNIIDNTLHYEIGNTEKPINTVVGEFPDRDADYQVVPTKLTSPLRGTDPERIEQVSYTSIVRKTQVAREMNFLLKKLTLIKRKWEWKAARTAVVSEPYDVDLLSYNVSRNLHGYAGFINGNDSTTTKLVTGKSIYLAAGLTFSAYVRHDNTVDTRLITNTTGQTYSILNLSSPLSFTPVVGDIFGVTSITNYIPEIQIDETEYDGTDITVRAHEHITRVYDDTLLPADTDTIPDITAGENVSGGTSSTLPPPLLGAQGLSFSIAGGTAGYLFNVVPNFSSLVGTYSALTTNTITLDTKESDIDDFFVGAYITADTDSARKVTAYNGTTRVATVTPDFSSASTLSAAAYQVDWFAFGDYYGFEVEGLNGSTWYTLDSVAGTSLTYVTANSYTDFRFTPITSNSLGNTTAQQVVSGGVVDSTPPLPPLSIFITSDDSRTATVDIDLNAPLERDTQYVEIEYITDASDTGDFSLVDYLDISDYRDEKRITSPLTVTYIRDLSSYPFGTTVYAKAATIDFYGNKSAYNTSTNSTVLSSTTTDPPTQTPIDTSGGASGPLTGGSLATLFTDIIDGGTIVDGSALELDLTGTVTAGSTTSTTITYYYTFAGVTTATIVTHIANGTSKITDNSDYFWTYLLESVSSSVKSSVAKKSGQEVPSVTDPVTSSSSLSVDASVNQTLAVYAQISGDTSAVINITGAALKLITGLSSPTSGNPYIISGTVPIAKNIAANTPVLVHPFTVDVTLEADLTTSEATCTTVAATTVSLPMKKNGTTFGYLTYYPGVTMGVFSAATQTSFTGGEDILSIFSPSSTGDTTLAGIGWSIYGTRNT